MSADFFGVEGEKNGGRHFRAMSFSTRPRGRGGRVCHRYGPDEPWPTWRRRSLRDFERKITKVSIASSFGPARGPQPGAQAGRHTLEGCGKWDVRDLRIAPISQSASTRPQTEINPAHKPLVIPVNRRLDEHQ